MITLAARMTTNPITPHRSFFKELSPKSVIRLAVAKSSPPAFSPVGSLVPGPDGIKRIRLNIFHQWAKPLPLVFAAGFPIISS